MIDRAYLAGQLESFEAQEEQLMAQLHRVQGGKATVRALIGRLERQADDARKADQEEAHVDSQAALNGAD